MIRLAETEIMSRDNALAFMDIVRLLCTHHEIETYEITVILSSFMECARIIKDYLEAIPAQAVDDEDDFGVFYDILAFSGRDAGKVIDLIRYAHERLSLQLEDIIAFLVVSSETLGDSRFRVFINRLHDCIGAENEGHLMMLTNIRMMINEPELLRVFIGRTAETFKRGLAAEFSPENVAREFREEIFNDEFLNQRMVPAAPWCGDFVTEAAGTVRFMCEKGVIIPENVAAAKAWFTKLIEIYQQEARSVVNKLWYFMHVLPEELLSAQLLNLLCQLTNDNPGMFSDTMELLARISKTGMIKTAGDLFEYGSLLSMNDMVDAFRALDKRRLNMSITSKKLMIQKVKDALLGIDMLKYLSEHADCRQFMVAAAESKISNKEFVGLSCRINELRTTRLKRMNMSALDLVLLACRTSGISFRKTINTVHKNSDMFADMEEFAGVQALVRMQAGGKGSISPAEAKSTSNVLLFTSV